MRNKESPVPSAVRPEAGTGDPTSAALSDERRSADRERFSRQDRALCVAYGGGRRPRVPPTLLVEYGVEAAHALLPGTWWLASLTGVEVGPATGTFTGPGARAEKPPVREGARAAVPVTVALSPEATGEPAADRSLRLKATVHLRREIRVDRPDDAVRTGRRAGEYVGRFRPRTAGQPPEAPQAVPSGYRTPLLALNSLWCLASTTERTRDRDGVEPAPSFSCERVDFFTSCDDRELMCLFGQLALMRVPAGSHGGPFCAAVAPDGRTLITCTNAVHITTA
ncbi:hypothetical protein [Streptomyces daliensis]|uniref:Uncharacterized protein n=1 Tax=Streptomyces daliensis TaxID=299421 RepID=A0A8T4ILR0_9ACTN|nr:hypothetical protein [Streptomyces daliensis]